MAERGAPVVTVGMPVYNGEGRIRRAIDALLAQTLSDFELIISDNASRDATPSICQEYASTDPRVRYERNHQNIGASNNFNRVFEMARGKYFKWAAHDDRVAPEFLAKCVDHLEAQSGAVLCWTDTVFVDEAERAVGKQPLRADPLSLTPQTSPQERFRQALYVHPGPPLFGVIRPDALKRTGLMRGTIGSDRVLVAELSLLGGFSWVSEPLMFYTHYPNARVGYYSAGWWNPNHQRPQPVRGALVQALQCASVVARSPQPVATQVALLGSVGWKYGRLTLRRAGSTVRHSFPRATNGRDVAASS